MHGYVSGRLIVHARPYSAFTSANERNQNVQDVDNERERKKQQELIDRVQVLHEKQGRAPLKLRLPVLPASCPSYSELPGAVSSQ